MKNNQHKKRTYIDRFARNYYCDHARLNQLRADKHQATKSERQYWKQFADETKTIAESFASADEHVTC